VVKNILYQICLFDFQYRLFLYLLNKQTHTHW